MITQEQIEAVRRFAAEYGRNWKSALRECWMTGNYRSVPRDDCALLQQVRNNPAGGSSWLAKFKV